MKFILLVLILALGGCASYTNLNDGRRNTLGGGFQDQKIGDGLFYILAKSNWAPWENFGAADSAFQKRANELCGVGYKILLRNQISYESMPGMRGYIISQIEGYVLSANSPLSDEDARKLAEEHRKRGVHPAVTWFQTRRPNQALEPTTLLVTRRADARHAPSRVVAHL